MDYKQMLKEQIELALSFANIERAEALMEKLAKIKMIEKFLGEKEEE